MKILVINPIGDDSWDESDKRFFQSVASPLTEIDVKSLGRGPPSVESRESFEEVLPLVKELALKLYHSYDGIIVNCFLDPSVDELKKLLDRPVVGPAESSLAFGGALGRRLGIASVGGDALDMIEDRVKRLGYGGMVVSVRGIKTPVTGLRNNWEKVKLELKEESLKAIEEGAETIILGCTGLAGLAGHVSKAVGKPVIDPAAAALKMIEGLISLVKGVEG